MPADLIRSSVLSDVAQYAYAAVVPQGARLVFLAGSCPLDASGSTVGIGDYRRQAEQCVATLRTVLAELWPISPTSSAPACSSRARISRISAPPGRRTGTPLRRTTRPARCSG